MVLSNQVHDHLQHALDTTIESVVGLTASDFNQTYRVHLTDGREVFLKLNEHCPADCFAAEAFGLNELAKAGVLKVAETYAHSDNFIATEWLAPSSPGSCFDEQLALGLIAQHSRLSDSFGFPLDNYCGASQQSNKQTEDGYAFFAEQRLIRQARRAFDSGLLNTGQMTAVETICAHLPDLIPNETPALLHGDLWRGNVLCTGDNKPALIDPACYYGWREADLAMMHLFGGFNSDVFSLYEELSPLPGGFRERRSLYNLYHLLNHLNLFGQAYIHDVDNVLRQYS